MAGKSVHALFKGEAVCLYLNIDRANAEKFKSYCSAMSLSRSAVMRDMIKDWLAKIDANGGINVCETD